jgi:hypothetical protein
MVWQYLVPAGIALLQGKQSAKAAQGAADTSAAASDRASEVQREMFDRNVELQAPFREGGLAAQNRLMTLLGLAPPDAPSGGGGGGFGGIVGMVAGAAKNALGQPSSGLNVDRNSPDFGRYARDFGMSDFQTDPGYAFRMSEGMKGLERSAAARGGLLSGGTLKGIQRFGQDLASQEYTNAFNRYQTNRAAQLNPLQSLAGVGQTSANTLGAAGTQFANTMGNIGMNQANVQGNAAMARASAYNNTLNQLSSLAGGYFGRPAGGGTASGIGPNTYSGQGPYGYAP